MKDKKLKVLWLCYFSNSEIQDQLKPYKRVGEFAPWISNMIPLFENDESIELHVISQHEWISGVKHFKKNGVYYYFINKGIPVIGRHWPGFFRFDIWTDLFLTKIYIGRIAGKIKPDIIHMHGTENVFCTAIKKFYSKFPVFITVQGFIHNSLINGKIEKTGAQKEFEILKMFHHYGYRTEKMGREIKSLNPNSVLHWHHYPMNDICPFEVEKQFDLVFFARVCKEKGIEDLLQAVAVIKKEKPDVNLCVIGGGKSDIWKKKAKELGISDNVYWAGFLPTQKDVHEMASTARISVLPTYHDIISGTIVESLFLKLPVVAYNVGSIHEVNKYEKIISLVDKFDINGLAKSVLLLLNNENLREKVAEKGYVRANEMFNTGSGVIKAELLNIYSEVIRDFIVRSK